MARDSVSPDQVPKSRKAASGRASEIQATAEQRAVLEVTLFQQTSRSNELVLELVDGELRLVSANS